MKPCVGFAHYEAIAACNPVPRANAAVCEVDSGELASVCTGVCRDRRKNRIGTRVHWVHLVGAHDCEELVEFKAKSLGQVDTQECCSQLQGILLTNLQTGADGSLLENSFSLQGACERTEPQQQ